MPCELTATGEDVVETLAECYREAERDVCDPVARRHGLVPASREGSGRRVFTASAIGDDTDVFTDDLCVVKVATGPDGRRQNETEVEVTRKMRGTPAIRYIAPVTEHDEEWVTMRWVGGDVSYEEVREWRDTMRSLGWACRDFKPENFGETADGTVKRIDYGDGCYRV